MQFMTDDNDDRPAGRRVGDTVQLARAGGDVAAGTVVDDFGDHTASRQSLGRDWAPPRRWAIALDTGTLVFADDDELT